MTYLELRFSPLKTEEEQSLLIAELSETGFESFVEEEHALLAYIPAEIYNEEMIKGLVVLRDHPEIVVMVKPLADINWNKEWESNYQPVTITGKCLVRAPFHPPRPELPFDIIIEPKMAFGTAHHETTQLMAAWLMDLDVEGKEVLDMGCGTGILAVLANKMKAGHVIGIDVDEWAWRNCIDNFRINGVTSGKVIQGDASQIKHNYFDLIMANINRNVLLQDMKSYSDGLKKNGVLLLSGFYQKDMEAITAAASACGMRRSGSRSLNDWAVLLFYK